MSGSSDGLGGEVGLGIFGTTAKLEVMVAEDPSKL